MADYKIVNADELDNGLSIVADSIRAKTGSTEKMPFPYGLKEQVDSIPEPFWTEEDVFNLMSNRKSMTHVPIPEGITSVPTALFYGVSNLVIENLPDTIETINTNGFRECSKLGLKSLPKNLKKLETSCFRESLTYITELPDGLITLGETAFLNNFQFSASSIPATVKTIGRLCFQSCNGITEMTFKGTPTSIESDIFNKCTNLAVINVPWSETDAINANAPWGATNATINYNYVETEE